MLLSAHFVAAISYEVPHGWTTCRRFLWEVGGSEIPSVLPLAFGMHALQPQAARRRQDERWGGLIAAGSIPLANWRFPAPWESNQEQPRSLVIQWVCGVNVDSNEGSHMIAATSKGTSLNTMNPESGIHYRDDVKLNGWRWMPPNSWSTRLQPYLPCEVWSGKRVDAKPPFPGVTATIATSIIVINILFTIIINIWRTFPDFLFSYQLQQLASAKVAFINLCPARAAPPHSEYFYLDAAASPWRTAELPSTHEQKHKSWLIRICIQLSVIYLYNQQYSYIYIY